MEQALPEYHSSALGRLGRSEEVEAEARRAYKTEENRLWYEHNPHGADAIAAAAKADDSARERTAEYLVAVRLEQLREQLAAWIEQAATAPRTDRLTELAARSLDGDVAGPVIARAHGRPGRRRQRPRTVRRHPCRGRAGARRRRRLEYFRSSSEAPSVMALMKVGASGQLAEPTRGRSRIVSSKTSRRRHYVVASAGLRAVALHDSLAEFAGEVLVARMSPWKRQGRRREGGSSADF
ncbi:hypothetical protein ACWDE9_18540 [Streptomyces olivaceoviridis]